MKLKALQRILREFPWLWALDHYWYHEMVDIIVTSANRSRFLESGSFYPDTDELWWHSFDGHIDKCVRVDNQLGRPPISLGEAAFSILTTGYHLMHVAHVKRIKPGGRIEALAIYRAPSRSYSLNQLWCDIFHELYT